MRKAGIFLLFSIITYSFSIINCTAQDFKLINDIPFTHASFTTDNLGNVYVITENQLLQFDSKGVPKASFSDRNAGRLQMVDASNPLKLLLFYPDFAQIKILNSKLAVESTIELRNIGILQPLAAASSVREGYWVYDMQDAQLKKISLNLQVQYESGNLNQLLGYSVVPNLIVEENNFIYLNNPSSGILVFDQYGSYVKTLPFKGLKTFQIVEQALLFVEDGKFQKYDLKTLEQNEVIIPQQDSLVSARIEDAKLYLLTTASLRFYSY